MFSLEFENIIYENLDIFSVNPRDKDARWIFPGLHVYKFQYQLPLDLPYSLDGSRCVVLSLYVFLLRCEGMDV
jgi:hypothetical protein